MTPWLPITATALAITGLAALALRPHLKAAPPNPRRLLLATLLTLPLFSLAFYWQAGTLDQWQLTRLLPPDTDLTQAPAPTRQAIQNRLETLTQRHPNTPTYWTLLAQLHALQATKNPQSLESALAAHARANALRPAPPKIRAQQAELQFIRDNYRLTPAVRDHLDAVLAADPNNPQALEILGLSAFRAAQYPAAARFWQRARQALPPNSPRATLLTASIEQALKKAKEPPPKPPPTPPPPPQQGTIPPPP